MAAVDLGHHLSLRFCILFSSASLDSRRRALSSPCSDIFCAGRVPEDDMERTRLACGGAVQTSVNNMSDDVLGSCERFEERQVRRKRGAAQRSEPSAASTVVTSSQIPFSPSPPALTLPLFSPLLQVGGERYNFFEGCPKAKTCTIVMRGGAAQFIEETERAPHDAIMIVRRAIKNDSVVAGGGAIEVGGWPRGLLRDASQPCRRRSRAIVRAFFRWR